MGNCLVTKLKGTVDNNNLSKLGEIKIHFNQVATPTVDTNGIKLSSTYQALSLRLNNGYFTNSTFTQNLGNTALIPAWTTNKIIYVANVDCNLFISGKYDSISLISHAGNEWFNTNIEVNIEDFSYMRYLKILNLRGMTVNGDIDKLYTDVEFSRFESANSNIHGDLTKFINNIKSSNCEITCHGDITLDINSLNNPVILKLYIYKSKKITGSLSHLASMTYHTDSRNNFPTSLSLVSDDASGVTGAVSDLTNYFDVNPNAPADNLVCNLGSCQNITGTLESLCNALVTKGKTGGTLTFTVNMQSAVTINGEAPTKTTYTVTFTNSGYTIA